MKSRHLTLISLLFGIFLSACAGTGPSGPADAQEAFDHRLKQQVLEAIRDEPFLSGANINVTASEGVVYLHGNVRRSADKSVAESAARSVDGVFDVVNNLSN